MPDSTVIDASVAVKWVIQEDGSAASRQLLLSGESFAAPDLLPLEVGSALCRKHRRRMLTGREVEEAMGDMLAVDMVYAPHAGLLADATTLSLGQRHALPDCLYLVLAQRRGAVLATFDTTLSALAKRLGIPLWTAA
jgi:predicted nucleic acid-binding protein